MGEEHQNGSEEKLQSRYLPFQIRPDFVSPKYKPLDVKSPSFNS
jgi:hypothetical protein